MKITFDDQTIEYRISFSYIDNGIKINITYPHSLTLKNEKRLKALGRAILADHEEIISPMIKKVAKDGKAIQKVNITCKASVFFESFKGGNGKDSFFFKQGVELAPGAKLTVDDEPGLEEFIRAGNPFHIVGKVNP